MADRHFEQALVWREQAGPLVWTPWQQVEFNNAVRALKFRGLVMDEDIAAVMASVAAAVAAGNLSVVNLPEQRLWREAEQLSRRHSARLGARTVDLLHVAGARVLGCSHLLSFDHRQTDFARAAGLTMNDER